MAGNEPRLRQSLCSVEDMQATPSLSQRKFRVIIDAESLSRRQGRWTKETKGKTIWMTVLRRLYFLGGVGSRYTYAHTHTHARKHNPKLLSLV